MAENGSLLPGVLLSKFRGFSWRAQRQSNVFVLGNERRRADIGAMEINEKLTRTIRGRTIELVSKEEGLVVIVFNDHSTMRVKVAGGPTVNMLGEGRIESAAEYAAELTLVGEDGRTATLRLAEPGSSVTVKDKDDQVEYAG